ncbi:uncharacterized protein [Periplaneta americana]
MDVIKMDPEVDPLAMQTSDSEEKKPLLEEVNLWKLHSTRIKSECEDHTSVVKFEESQAPPAFHMVKCEVEEEMKDLDTIKEEPKVGITTEETELSTGSVTGVNRRIVSSTCEGVTNEESLTMYEDPSNFVSSGNLPSLTVMMDVIKTESDINPWAIQSSETEEKKPLSEEGNLLDLHVTGIKEECMDDTCDLTSEIKFEEITMPNHFPFVKCEVEEESCVLHIEKEELKVLAEEDGFYSER